MSASAVRRDIFGKNSRCSSDEECARQLGFDRVAYLNQVHGKAIHVVSRPMHGTLDGDGLITATPGLALSVRWADCQAFAISAPKKNVIGLLHAGWRGMAAQAITAFYERLRREFGISPEETSVYAAPSLCLRCAEFTDPKRELPEHLHPFMHGRNVDLQAAAEAEFDALGIPKGNRERHPACTRCGKGFWSYRKGEKTERNFLVAGILS